MPDVANSHLGFHEKMSCLDPYDPCPLALNRVSKNAMNRACVAVDNDINALLHTYTRFDVWFNDWYTALGNMDHKRLVRAKVPSCLHHFISGNPASKRLHLLLISFPPLVHPSPPSLLLPPQLLIRLKICLGTFLSRESEDML